MEPKVVMAVGTSSSAGTRGRAVSDRIQKAMADAVLECNAEGISTSEENTPIIRARRDAARQRVLDEVKAEESR